MIGKDVRRYVVATEEKKGQQETELVSAAVLLAVCRSGPRVGGAAIKVARSRSTMLPADTPCLGKCFAAFYLALFSGATTMPAAHSLRRRTGGSGAVAGVLVAVLPSGPALAPGTAAALLNAAAPEPSRPHSHPSSSSILKKSQQHRRGWQEDNLTRFY